jgi:hypothetical protein
MTMHLASHAYNTVRNRKHKPKMTKANIAKWTEDCRLFNKQMKQLGQPRLTLEEYIDYVHGKRKMPNPAKDRSAFKPYTPPSTPVYRRGDTSHIPSHDNGIGVAAKTENMKYTGTLIKGIATMHKSNAVPIIDDQQAKDIASMRR